MDTEKIRLWLKAQNRDRHWFADQVGVSKSTTDGWFSGRLIPESKQRVIERLMQESGESVGHFTVSFTTDEFEEIEQARSKAGYRSREEFYHDAVMQLAREILERDSQNNVHPISDPQPVVAPKQKTGTGKRGG